MRTLLRRGGAAGLLEAQTLANTVHRVDEKTHKEGCRHRDFECMRSNTLDELAELWKEWGKHGWHFGRAVRWPDAEERGQGQKSAMPGTHEKMQPRVSKGGV